MSFILDLQGMRDARERLSAEAMPSTTSLSLCFSNQSWIFC
ncbi:SapB/AmfS family lanthipeptide [Microbispora sp. NPDC088329]